MQQTIQWAGRKARPVNANPVTRRWPFRRTDGVTLLLVNQALFLLFVLTRLAG